jgi:hypothetical protein
MINQTITLISLLFRLVILAVLLFGLSGEAHDQWTTSGSNTTTSNNVGIGTAAPAFKLDISTAANGDGLRIGAGDTSAESSANIVIRPSSASSAQRNWCQAGSEWLVQTDCRRLSGGGN